MGASAVGSGRWAVGGGLLPAPGYCPLPTAHRPPSIQRVLQRSGQRVGAEEGEGAGFELAGALAGDAEGRADLLEGARRAAVEAMAQDEQGALAGWQGAEEVADAV